MEICFNSKTKTYNTNKIVKQSHIKDILECGGGFRKKKKAHFKRDIKGATMPYLKSTPFKEKEGKERRKG